MGFGPPARFGKKSSSRDWSRNWPRRENRQHPGVPPKMKNGAPRDELKNGRGRGWAVAYFNAKSEPLETPKF